MQNNNNAILNFNVIINIKIKQVHNKMKTKVWSNSIKTKKFNRKIKYKTWKNKIVKKLKLLITLDEIANLI